ncbi:hypothetical protein [Spirillospora sp. NPDC047279]|uniref:MinD/ParA family ATP-binding protein n=1 Tax=Spirillospora sp. NPDC047279 TaxID=3155478 RepID=UPI0033FFE2F7
MRKVVGASAAMDVRDSAQLDAVLGQPVPSCRRIVVSSIRGGAGKSSVAALVADVIRQHRGDRVLAVDADPGLGSLPLRLGVSSSRSLRDLASARPRSWEEAAPYLMRTDEGLWVLSCNVGQEVGAELGYDVFQAGAGRVSRYFSTSVIDCGAGLVGGLQKDIIASAHAQVFVAPGTGDGAASAMAALHWFVEQGFGPLLARTVIVLTAHTPDPDTDLVRAGRMLAGGGLAVEIMPYDRHLAAGVTIAAERVGAASRTVATRVAARVFAHSLSWGTS